MKLLVDEMYSSALADQLRQRGHDVIAVCETPDLVGMSDEALLAWAHREGRALFTESAGDFIPLHAMRLQEGQRHSGLIVTSNARHPRRKASTLGVLVKALDELLRATPSMDTDVRWLT